MTDTQQRVAMGYIKGVFGIKGWLKIAADTEYTDSLLDYPEWQLSKDGRRLNVTLEAGKIVNGELQVKFEGINDRDEAFALRGYTIEIPRESFAPAEEGEYYWADLVGMTVVNTENITLGTVKNLMETGAHDVLVVDGDYGQKLIPFVSHFIGNVDSENRIITADWGTDY
ncbi:MULTISPECIES: ribosome maturation factor RimM [Neisseria]|uniref:Ribosome maturation factor RimM n=1 Tax=Neisseria dumasiana TaxID=1931275 RepID=A0A1X3D4T6_9NEIS|nr:MULTISPECIES: ribosome maturation factor RimM [Neisseria]KPN73810.1 ribosome maturation factor RimM [Neisseria sp. 74A18]OSI14752.1 ribosome maturation factor RimM [Neisseria dumasiana]OSI31836.1 ribosome maturation factor RimM [Neisseria dumasiana]UOO84054.1 ribosome maturation factor RimM [Neisseria dumasiana]